MAKEDKAASSDKGKEKEQPVNGVNGTKEPEKDKDGKEVKKGIDGDLPPGTSRRSKTVYPNMLISIL